MKDRFELSSTFLEPYKTTTPPFGFNGLGELVYKRTYARQLPDGSQESWWQTVQRVVEGCYNMQRRHILQQHLGWNARKAQRSAQEMFDRIFHMKFLPPGRGLWAMGSALTEERNLHAALLNCAFVSTKDLAQDLADPFTFLMDASMLGIGVGFDTKGAGKLTLHAPADDAVHYYAIPDTREGWVESVRELLLSYFLPAQASMEFDYSLIRPEGEPIRGFGGVSAGPGPLRTLHEAIRTVLNAGVGAPITITQIVDVMNLIGKCVVAGNVRRCFVENTMVTTERGIVPIRDVTLADRVLTSDGTYRQVKDHVYQGVQETVIVRTSHGPLQVTPDHRVAVLTGPRSYEWREAQSLTPADRLVSVPHTAGIESISTDWAWLLGLFCADGHADIASSERRNGGGGSVTFSCNVDHGVAERVEQILNEAGHKTTRTVVGNCERVVSYSKDLAELLLTIKGVYATPRIPEEVWQGTPAIRGAFLAGVADGDGGGRNVVCNSNKRDFLGALQKLLLSLGIASTIHLRGPKVLHGRDRVYEGCHWLSLRGLVAQRNAASHIEPHAVRWRVEIREGKKNGLSLAPTVTPHNLRHLTRPSKKGGTIRGANHDTLVTLGVMSDTWLPIEVLGVEHAGAEETYDISVDTNTEFIAEGLLVHNTAEIAFGEYNSTEFLDLKNYEVNPQRAEYGWTSNNSIFANLGMDYTASAERVALNGEPGYAWLDNMRAYGRMGDPATNNDVRVEGTNPCVEQSLESYECCCLCETFPANHEDLEDYQRTLKFAYLYAKTVTLLTTPWERTNRVMLRNRRIGLSQSGIQQAVLKLGIGEYVRWCEVGYSTVQHYDRVYSEWFAIPRSIKTTSIKPSGSVSLLAGATPGLHWPESLHYLRRMRLSKYSDLVQPLIDAGYQLEPAFGSEDSTLVVEIPVKLEAGLRTVKDVSMWEQLAMAALLQRVWADNQVSATITFDPATEGPQIAHALNYYQYQLKGVSFLPRVAAGAYPQMPYEEISADTYAARSAALRPLTFGSTHETTEQERFCDGQSCVLL